jgi:hypothetical protein
MHYCYIVTLLVLVLYCTVQEKFELVVLEGKILLGLTIAIMVPISQLVHADNANNSSTIIYCTNIVAAQKVGTEPTFLVDSGRVVAPLSSSTLQRR